MLTTEKIKALDYVHDKLIRIFEYKPDKEQFGQNEFWIEPKVIAEAIYKGKLVGDCDDFALACRQELWKCGIENRLVMCYTETREGHLVCEVEGYILDNRFNCVKTNSDLNYTWVKMSGYRTGDSWTTIDET